MTLHTRINGVTSTVNMLATLLRRLAKNLYPHGVFQIYSIYSYNYGRVRFRIKRIRLKGQEIERKHTITPLGWKIIRLSGIGPGEKS